MTEIPGARAELDRLAEWLFARLRDLATELTPGREPNFAAREPVIADWHEPLRYRYQVTARVERDTATGAHEVADAAARLLGAAGWEITREESPEASTPHIDIVGTREGFRIAVRAEKNYPGVVYTAHTPMLALYPPREFTPPPPRATAETLLPGYVLCHECHGLGWCPECRGSGWIEGDTGREKCPECHGSQTCPVCGGSGQLNGATLADWEREHYPDSGGESGRV